MARERTRFVAKRKGEEERAATIYIHKTALDRLARLAAEGWHSDPNIDCSFSRFGGAVHLHLACCKIFATFVRRISYHRNSVHEVLNDPAAGNGHGWCHDQRTSNIDPAVAKKRAWRCSGNFTLVRRKRAVSLVSCRSLLPPQPPHFCSCLRKSRRG